MVAVALLAVLALRAGATNAVATGPPRWSPAPTDVAIGAASNSTAASDSAPTSSVRGVSAFEDSSSSASPPPSASNPSQPAGPALAVPPAMPGCRPVTYTPPTASAPQGGELCVPSVPSRGVSIVLVHGGGGSSGSRADLNAWRDVYVANGYETFAIDYTTIGSRGPQTIFPLPEQNTKAAIQWLRKNEGPRAAKVLLHGASAGARLGGIVLTTAGHPRFAGKELWPDVSDAIDGLIGFYGYYNGAQYQYAGYFAPGDELDPAISSTSRARFATGPVIMFHGEDDTFIPPSESQRFADRLRAAGKPVELTVVPKVNHGFDGYDELKLSPEGSKAADRVVQWLRQFNQP